MVAVQAYELIPAAAGLALAFAVATTATILAIRWEAEGIAGLGILGAVASPVLVGAELGPATTAFLFLATASAVGVVLWQRWTWLAFATFVLATPQWVAWLVVETPSTPEILVTLLAFGGLGVVAAVGFELRTRTETVDYAPHLLLALNALVLAWIGWGALSETAGDTAGHAWLAGLAVAHLACAAAGRRMAGVSRDLSLAAAVLGVALADIAFASVVDGLPLVAGWAASGVAMAALVRAATHRLDAEVALGRRRRPPRPRARAHARLRRAAEQRRRRPGPRRRPRGRARRGGLLRLRAHRRLGARAGHADRARGHRARARRLPGRRRAQRPGAHAHLGRRGSRRSPGWRAATATRSPAPAPSASSRARRCTR